MKNKSFLSPKACVAVGAALCSCLSAAAAVLYYMAYHSGQYDRAIHHYVVGNNIHITAFVLFAAAAVVSLATALSVKSAGLEEADMAHSFSIPFGSFFTAFVFIVYFILSLYSYSPLPKSPSFGEICTYVCPFLGLLSAIPFICDTSASVRRTAFHRITAFIPIIWGAFIMFKYYFDLDEIPLNDPELTVTNVSIAAVILFFLVESRRTLMISSPFKCTASAFFASFITLPIAAARIALCITDGFTIPNITENILLVSIGIFAVIRIASDAGSYIPPAAAEVCDTPDKAENASD